MWENEWDEKQAELKDKLKAVFKGEEDLRFDDERLELDRSFYNGVTPPGYELAGSTEPKMAYRSGYEVEDCGTLIFERVGC